MGQEGLPSVHAEKEVSEFQLQTGGLQVYGDFNLEGEICQTVTLQTYNSIDL